MALTDLKSDLSKFRRPVEKSILDNQSVEINRTSNLTPLSDLTKRLSSPNPLKETVAKTMVTPTPFDKTEKFKGQTTPNDFDFKPEFTTTTPNQVNNTEKFKGETEPSPLSLESQFLGETSPTDFNFSPEFTTTTPNQVNNTEKFKGETTPNDFDFKPEFTTTTPNQSNNIEKFKGETTPNDFDFKPEFTTPKLSSVDFFPNTNADGFTARMKESRFNFSSLSSPTPMTLEEKFLGETDPNRMSLESQFLGETSPTDFNFSPEFTTTTPNDFDFKPEFTTTTPNDFDFKPEFTTTTPNDFDFKPEFTTTTPNDFDFKPEFTTTTPNQADNTEKFKGETEPSPLSLESQFLGETSPTDFDFTPKFKTQKVRTVNFFSNEDGVGFTKNFNDKNKSQFTGINGETFASPKVTFSGDFGLSFSPGNKIKLEGSSLQYYTNGNQKWQPGGKRYEDNYVSIGDLLIKENSPSYITKIYGQFNLKDDSFNPYPLFFKQPFILRGIQRKGKKEPQKWGLGNLDSIMGIDLIRGGVTTSTERALVDVVRIGKFILSPKGLVWSAMQFGMQRTNTYNKVWTPLNLLTAVGGQHLGLKPKRHGLLPFVPDNSSYQNLITNDYKTSLENIRNTSIFSLDKGGIAVLKSDKRGGWDSIYGINVAGPSTIRTSTNTFNNPEKTYAENEAMTERGLPAFFQNYNPFFKKTTKTTTSFVEPPIEYRGKLTDIPEPIEVVTETSEKGVIGSNDTFENTYGKAFGVKKGNVGGFYKEAQDEYKKLGVAAKSYDKGKTPQSGYEQMWENSNPKSNKLKTLDGEEALNYNDIRDFANDTKITKTSFNDFRTKYKSGGDKKNKLKDNITKYSDNYYTDKNIERRVGLGNYDNSIGQEETGGDFPDLIKLTFSTEGVGTIQFRGTVNAITETYSPNWTDIKYSGRAENAYIYDTFGRELNFGFRVYAYSVKELLPMWQKLDKLGRMSMPTYGSAGYYGNITKFTLGTMYTNFPALISSLQYQVLDEFTWEIGLNAGSGGNELPMGVDVTIGLKLLGKKLHSTGNTRIYDYKTT